MTPVNPPRTLSTVAELRTVLNLSCAARRPCARLTGRIAYLMHRFARTPFCSRPVARFGLGLRTGLVAGLLLTGCATLPRTAGSQQPTLTERTAYLMGTTLRAVVAVPDPDSGAISIEAAFGAVREAEALLSSWRSDSEIGRANAAPAGVPVRVSTELNALLAEVSRWVRASGGAFDPAVGPLLDAWDLRGSGRRPDSTELQAALAATGWSRWRLELAAGTLTRPNPTAWLDTGAFGKGYGLRQASTALRRSGAQAALLDFGGQLLALGAGPEGGYWLAAVAHPARREEPAVQLRLRDVSASTSSASERWVEANGERLGHIVDPRTGRPVPAWGSVTVVTPDPVLADVLSTALFVLGPEAGRDWIVGVEGVGVVWLELVPDAAAGVRASCNEAVQRWLTNGCRVGGPATRIN